MCCVTLVPSSEKKNSTFSCVSRNLISVRCADAFNATGLSQLFCRYVIEFAFVREYIDVMDFDGSSKLCLVVPGVCTRDALFVVTVARGKLDKIIDCCV